MCACGGAELACLHEFVSDCGLPADYAAHIGELHGLTLLQGILGQGSGKALEAKSAVDKATRKALKHLMYVPRFRAHTIHYPLTVLYGKTKVRQRCGCLCYWTASAAGGWETCHNWCALLVQRDFKFAVIMPYDCSLVAAVAARCPNWSLWHCS
jgi:hypothetical protein